MRLHCITCFDEAAHDKRWFEFFESSARKFGLQITNAHTSKWGSYADKLIAYESAVRSFPDSDILLFSDAYDVIFAQPSETILSRFSGIATFAAESVSWPYQRTPDNPSTSQRWKFLNAGLWMAGAIDAKRILTASISIMAAAESIGKCDQSILIEVFRNSGDFLLDSNCELFQCLNDGSMDLLQFDGRSIINTETGTSPCAFHGNGGIHMRPIPAWLGLE